MAPLISRLRSRDFPEGERRSNTRVRYMYSTTVGLGNAGLAKRVGRLVKHSSGPLAKTEFKKKWRTA